MTGTGKRPGMGFTFLDKQRARVIEHCSPPCGQRMGVKSCELGDEYF